MGTKICNRCRVEKSLDFFSKNKRQHDGLQVNCKQCNSEVMKAYRETPEGRAVKLEIQRRYRASEKGRQTSLESSKAYRRADLGRASAYARTGHAMRRNRVPPWASFEEVVAIYRQAKELTEQTGIKHHVDHIVPLRSPLVSGLHWAGNLQILQADENMAKSNLVWPDMPDDPLDVVRFFGIRGSGMRVRS
jgi:hypothetical protein